MTAKFLYHEPCENCGSKDNNAVYDDGHSFCFGCRKYVPGKESIHKVHNPLIWIDAQMKDFPHDAQLEIPAKPLQWLLQYGITQHIANKYGIMYSPYRQCLCWQIKDPEGTTLGWSSRNFSPDARVKAISHGKIHEDINIVGTSSSSKIVLVEDYISAIKVSQHIPCMPLYGCTVSLETLQGLSKRFKGVILWLDSNKLDNARKIAQRAALSGLTGQVLYTELDPKCYTKEEIRNFLAPLNLVL